jgi:hypothetical protein
MNSIAAATERLDVVVEIGGIPIRIGVDDPSFSRLLQERYAGFVTTETGAEFDFEIDLAPPGLISPDEDVRVRFVSGQWSLDRGDFHAEWDAASARGHIRQTANPYSIDTVLRIVHTILLAKEGGFLVHAASAVRNGRAFIFSGVSGAGKTTISRLAPADATLLTDEISYVRRRADGSYHAFGTPFTGELAKLGENIHAPIECLYLLKQGPENRVDPVDTVEATRALLSNILFFAEDAALVRQVFNAACEFVARVPVYRLTFLPDTRVWELII